jgi:hypothetical protein
MVGDGEMEGLGVGDNVDVGEAELEGEASGMVIVCVLLQPLDSCANLVNVKVYGGCSVL